MDELMMKGLELIIRIIALIIAIAIEIKIAKHLIRYGIDYYFKMKEYHDSKNAIDEIQQDIIRKHPREDEP